MTSERLRTEQLSINALKHSTASVYIYVYFCIRLQKQHRKTNATNNNNNHSVDPETPPKEWDVIQTNDHLDYIDEKRYAHTHTRLKHRTKADDTNVIHRLRACMDTWVRGKDVLPKKKQCALSGLHRYVHRWPEGRNRIRSIDQR